MPNQTMTGRCLCGAVTFRAEGVEPHVHACHCGMCRRWSGGPGLAATVGSVEFQGEEQIAVFDSSDWAARGFCKTCGTNLFYRLKEPQAYFLWSGVFDDASAFELAGEIYIEEKPAFYGFVGDHPRQTGEEFMKAMGMAPPN